MEQNHKYPTPFTYGLQRALTSSKLTIKTLEQDVKYVQS